MFLKMALVICNEEENFDMDDEAILDMLFQGGKDESVGSCA